jgi:hypothetical protein
LKELPIVKLEKFLILFGLGKIPDTHYPYPNYLNPRYPIPISDSDCDYPKLLWVTRVIHSGTRTTQNLHLSLYLFTCC